METSGSATLTPAVEAQRLDQMLFTMCIAIVPSTAPRESACTCA
jgi:hypothetical protein